jgi:hypothetical protein
MGDGTVIIIGGAEDKVRDRVILSRFVTLAGGRDATIAVVSTASSLGAEAGERYRQIFTELGVAKVHTLHAVTRPQANDETAGLAVRDATGIFLTGGNQPGRRRRSADATGRRDPGAVPRGRRRRDVGGASAMSSHMIAFGASGATPKHRMAQIAAGLGCRWASSSTSTSSSGTGWAAAVADRPEPVAGPRRGRGHGRSRRARRRDGGHGRGRSRSSTARVRDRRVGDQGPQAADDQRCRAPLAAAGYRFDLRRRQRLATPTLHAIQGGGEAASS